MQRSLPFVVAVISALALSASCSRTTASPSETDTASSTAAQPTVQTLNITHDATTVGAEVRATASGLPAGKTVELTWKTVSGGWVVPDDAPIGTISYTVTATDRFKRKATYRPFAAIPSQLTIVN